MTKVLKFPSRGKAHRLRQQRQASPNKNCADDGKTGNLVPNGTVPNLADPSPKEKRRLSLPPDQRKVVAEYWVHTLPNGKELQFDKEPDHVPALHVFVVSPPPPNGNLRLCPSEYTATFDKRCLSDWRTPHGDGWARTTFVPEDVKWRLKTDQPSTVWTRRAVPK